MILYSIMIYSAWTFEGERHHRNADSIILWLCRASEHRMHATHLVSAVDRLGQATHTQVTWRLVGAREHPLATATARVSVLLLLMLLLLLLITVITN